MVWHTIRPGEITGQVPDRADASIIFIGRVRTPFLKREDCPRQGSLEGPICTLEIDEAWRPALLGLEQYSRVQVLYWMDKSRRDLLVQVPRHSHDKPMGTFALRSPMRPNPIASSIAELVSVEPDGKVLVRGLDCLDGTPLVDLKPARCPVSEPSAPKAVV